MQKLDKTGPVPLYYQLKVLLQQSIDTGEWRPNDRLPTESELSTQYGISKITVRQALSDLVRMGYVRREQGRGTFVAESRLEQGPRELTSFTEEMRRHGVKAASRILEQHTQAAGKELADKLEITEGTEVLVLKRLRLAGAEPMGVQTAHIPLHLAPGLKRERFASASLYEILGTKYNLYADTARETHSAIAVDADTAALLQVPKRSPALAAERIAFLSDRRPLEYVTSIMRGDRYHIVLDLIRQRGPKR